MVDVSHIPGLHYHPDYVTEQEQAALVAQIEQQPWITDLKRRVQHYGYRYNYSRRTLDPSMYLGPLPEWITPLAQRLQDDGWMEQLPNQLIINEYAPGQGISAHIDCVLCFGNTIVSVSLLSACVMLFANTADAQQHIPVLLEPRSLTVMQGDARYTWKHSIAARKSDDYHGRRFQRGQRISLTFRNVLTEYDAYACCQSKEEDDGSGRQRGGVVAHHTSSRREGESHHERDCVPHAHSTRTAGT